MPGGQNKKAALSQKICERAAKGSICFVQISLLIYATTRVNITHTFEEGDVMNILEEFWYGNIEPAEYDTSSSKEYKELLQLISRNEEKLLATMTDEQKDLFTKYADCVREYQVMAECLLFQNSFRLGGRMMLEVMRDSVGGE